MLPSAWEGGTLGRRRLLVCDGSQPYLLAVIDHASSGTVVVGRVDIADSGLATGALQRWRDAIDHIEDCAGRVLMTVKWRQLAQGVWLDNAAQASTSICRSVGPS